MKADKKVHAGQVSSHCPVYGGKPIYNGVDDTHHYGLATWMGRRLNWYSLYLGGYSIDGVFGKGWLKRDVCGLI